MPLAIAADLERIAERAGKGRRSAVR